MLLAQEPNALMNFLRLIPDFIWPLIAVIIGGMLAWIPLSWQLIHDSKERERERQMSLRRDVYLFAAKKIGQLLVLCLRVNDDCHSERSEESRS